MIAANELRIGNWLKNFIGEYFQVNTATIQSFIDGMHPFGCPMPIPLTPEILEKAGFEKFENKDYGPSWHHNESGNWIQYDKGFNGEQYLADAESGIRLDYVHQLQNLYFLYLSEELTINL